jgi:hypothetical protein
MNQIAPKKKPNILLTSDRPHTVYGGPESRRCTAVRPLRHRNNTKTALGPACKTNLPLLKRNSVGRLRSLTFFGQEPDRSLKRVSSERR